MLSAHGNSIVNLIFAAGLVIYGLLVWTGRATRPSKPRLYAVMGFLLLAIASLMGPKRAFAGPWIAVPAGTILLAAVGALFLWLEPRKAGPHRVKKEPNLQGIRAASALVVWLCLAFVAALILVPQFVPYVSKHPELRNTMFMTCLFLAPVFCFVLLYRMNERA